MNLDLAARDDGFLWEWLLGVVGFHGSLVNY